MMTFTEPVPSGKLHQTVPLEKYAEREFLGNYKKQLHCLSICAILIKLKNPGVAQLVACLNGVQEAGRSNRPTRT